MSFSTAATEAMRIDSSGNVGIGTSSPSYKADILATNQYALRLNTTHADGCFLAIQTNGTAKGYLGISHHLVTGSPSENDITLRAEGNLQFTTGGGTERMRIDNSGNVGIGTSSPLDKLTVDGGNIRLESSTTQWLYASDTNTVKSGFNFDVANKNLIAYTNAAERLRIDSSGNVLVGGTSAYAVDAVTLAGSGLVYSSRTSNQSGQFDRRTTDGEIIRFTKNGAPVGSIGAKSNDLCIGTDDTGLRFGDGGNSVIPHNMATNTTTDGIISFGTTTERFKDLYLSGGVYLGGTGAANKLDDYESGTWTPTTATGTLTSTTARYTKVGRKVTIILEGVSFSDTTTVVTISIGGLPFAVDGTGNGSAMWQYNGKPSDNAYCVTVINFYSGNNSGGFAATKHSDLINSANSVYLTATYFAT